VWYTRGPIGRNNLQAYTKLLAKDVPALKGRKIINKTERGTRITRLNKALVPIEKAMETTGHRSIDAYEKYNQKKKYILERATQRVLSGQIKDGHPLLYSDAYKEELERRDMKVGFVASYLLSFLLLWHLKLVLICCNLFAMIKFYWGWMFLERKSSFPVSCFAIYISLFMFVQVPTVLNVFITLMCSGSLFRRRTSLQRRRQESRSWQRKQSQS
jgi:hypothetical protein